MNLLETKLGEYADFPALVLGLDGWLLKSVPADVRSQFLRAYHKTLQIAFHPDRVTSAETKESRERYLQVVSEAIAYLSDSPINYELATDNVPTRRNPLVELRRGTIARDEMIEQKCSEISRLMEECQKNETEIQNAKMAQSKAISAMQLAQYSGIRMRHWLWSHVEHMIPLRSTVVGFKGCYMSAEELVEVLNSDSPFSTKKPTVKMQLQKGYLNGVSVAGSMSKVYLQEFINYRAQWSEVSSEKAVELLKNSRDESLKNFILPFVSEQLILLVGNPARFVLVKTIDSETRHFRCLEKQLKVEARNNRIKVRELKRKVRDLTYKNDKLSEELKKLTGGRRKKCQP